MLNLILTKLVLATVIVIVAEVLTRRQVRPQVSYAAWFAAVLVLLMPPVVTVPLLRTAKAALASPAKMVGISDCEVPSARSNVAAVSVGATGGEAAVGLETSVANSEAADLTGRLGWREGAVGLWIAGTVGILIWRGRKRFILGRLVQAATPVEPKFVTRCQVVAEETGLGNCPQIVMANGVFSPFLWHPIFGKAHIVFPQELLRSLSDESAEAIVRHEFVHVRRRDTLRHHVEALALALWWWFPCAWLVSKRLREYEELCADSEVIRSAPHARRAYATALLDAYEFLTSSPNEDLVAAPTFAKRKFLKTRIEMIVSNKLEAPNRRLTAVVASALGFGLVSVGFLTVGEAKPDQGVPLEQEPVAEKGENQEKAPVARKESATNRIEREKQIEIPATTGGRLKLNVPMGSIFLKTHDKDSVVLDSTMRAPKENAEELFEKVKFAQQSKDGVIEILIEWTGDQGGKSKLGLGHELLVPRSLSVDLATGGGSVAIADDIQGNVSVQARGGSVALNNVSGDLAVQTSGGSIAVDDVGGNADIRTSGGSIKSGAVGGNLQCKTSGGSIVAALANQISQPVDLTTSGGGVVLVVPKDLKAHLIAKTSGGSIAGDLINAVGKPTAVDEMINGGGEKVTIKTSGGNIVITTKK